jgi:hypothetical protein
MVFTLDLSDHAMERIVYTLALPPSLTYCTDSTLETTMI